MGLSLFGLFLTVSAFAQIDLRDQFISSVDQQIGASCHVYAEVALFEAACYRLTGKRINLSEAALFEKHLAHEMKAFGESCTNPSVHSDAFVLSKNADLGIIGPNLERINNGEACLESEFPMSEKTLIQVKSMMDSLQATEPKVWAAAGMKTKEETVAATKKRAMIQQKLKALQSQLLILSKENDYYKNTLSILSVRYQIYQTELALKSLDQFSNSSNERLKEHKNELIEQQAHFAFVRAQNLFAKDLKAMTQTHSVILKKCAEAFSEYESDFEPTPEKIIQILRQKKPLMCTDGHAMLIIGYRYTAEEKIEWLLRDSQYGDLKWETHICQKIYWLD